jgi:hypothetical protein
MISPNLSTKCLQSRIYLLESSREADADHHHKQLHVVPAESESHVHDFAENGERNREGNVNVNEAELAVEEEGHRIVHTDVVFLRVLENAVGRVRKIQHMLEERQRYHRCCNGSYFGREFPHMQAIRRLKELSLNAAPLGHHSRPLSRD